MKLAWCTDIHLNFLDDVELAAFCHEIALGEPDALVITGDISEAPTLEEHLQTLERLVARPIYFVLGNHDYYRGSIAAVRAEVRALVARSRHLTWMPLAGVVPLAQGIALVGHDGWADGRFGDFVGSRVMLNDYLHIDELAYLPKTERLAKLHALGDESAEHLRSVLPLALRDHEHVVVATHVPPFEAACLHDGTIASPTWLPHFSCRATGEALLEAARAHPTRRLTVLCGHTHERADVAILPNLAVLCGAADYGNPRIERTLELTSGI